MNRAVDPLAPVRGQLATGDVAAAERTCRAALASNPADARAHGLLAHVLQRAGRHADALAAAERSLALAPDFAPSLLERSAAARALGQWDLARDSVEALLRLAPDRAPLHYDLGVVLLELGEHPAARASFERALALDPRLVDAEFKLGVYELANNEVERAYARFIRCTEIRPTWVEAWLNRAECLCRTGQFEAAIDAAQQALKRAPERVDALRIYGRALLGAKKDYAEWVWVRQRIAALDPSPRSRVDLALALWEGYFYREAAQVLDAVVADHPEFLPAHWGRFQYPLDVFQRDEDSARAYLERWRGGLAGFEARFDASPDPELARDSVRLATNFYLHYLGEPFVEEQRRYGALLERMARVAEPDLPPPKPLAPPGTRRRVGFVSAYLRNHTIFKLFAPLIRGLDRERFELHVYMIEADTDERTESLRAHVDVLEHASPDPQPWVQRLAAAHLDVLVYLDLGMHPLAQLLSAHRFAPVQAVMWGHPVTTGLSTIDYFLSSEAMEPPDGDAHYTERLVRLPNLGIAYEPPTVEPRAPDSWTANPHESPVDFFFAQTVYKITPLHDDVFARICEALPGARIHLLPHPHQHVRDELRARIARAFEARGLDMRRHVVLHPSVPLAGFLGIAASCDFNLDSIGWSGGNTTLEILWHDVPTITLPGAVMRARHTYAMLKLLELDELVAADLDDYVDLAIALGRDPDRRARLRAAIGRRKQRLYRDRAAIDAMVAWLGTVAVRAGS